jgi:hypothetical protein
MLATITMTTPTIAAAAADQMRIRFFFEVTAAFQQELRRGVALRRRVVGAGLDGTSRPTPYCVAFSLGSSSRIGRLWFIVSALVLPT